jgi:hypothetical protein
MIDHEHELVSLDELRSTLKTYSGPDEPRQRPREHRRHRVRQLVLLAVALAALASAAVGIADGFGAFDGISAAQHAPTGADALDAKTLAGLQNACPSHVSFYTPTCHLVLNSIRRVGQVQPYGDVYVVTDTRGDLCTVLEGGDTSCSPPLSESHPITFGSFNPSATTGGTFVATGLAIDGVTAVSFTIDGKAVKVPVTNNLWIYTEPDSHATSGQCILAHLDNGTTITPFRGAPCP